MKYLRRLICLLRGHTPSFYEKDGLYYARCKTCKVHLDTNWRGTFW